LERVPLSKLNVEIPEPTRHRTVAVGVKFVLKSPKAPHSTVVPASIVKKEVVTPLAVVHDVLVAPRSF
jgi:hypothetical protein